LPTPELPTPELPTLEEIARLAGSDDRVAGCVELAATHLAGALLPAIQLLDPEVVMVEDPSPTHSAPLFAARWNGMPRP
jgi:predicted NBD/HSP70 family sugar kinase